MATYIEREAIKYEQWAVGPLNAPLMVVRKKTIDSIPAADVAPVEPAHWICRVILDYRDERKDRRVWACSNCGTEEEKRRKFCPECGRKMAEEG